MKKLENNPYILKSFSENKEVILDIKATIDSKKLVDIEMQLQNSPSLMSRILFYWARLYASQIKQGNDYSVLQKTTSILILDDLSHS
ncbi:MAG: Rpn family recombination-promoting nuclease/putative transposase, partial [Methanospirillum hungatei]|nr:Rpn family recombination-promoting nuclease/putative transposase [Methanospirillum hungatei]